MSEVHDVCKRAKEIAPAVAGLASEEKNAALEAMARSIEDQAPELLTANARDADKASDEGVSSTVVDRLTLTRARLQSMAASFRAVAAQRDPVGHVAAEWTRPNGLLIQKVRAPLGVVAVIYEARPNVTADVAGLCLKSGNTCVLRGSSIASASNQAIVDALKDEAAEAGAPRDAIQLIRETDRTSAVELMQAKGLVDLLVPRGGETLIRTVEEQATVPFIIDGAGNCHIYVDQSANIEMATDIVLNAKTQRPSVCNAAETLLVHDVLATGWLRGVLDALHDTGTEIRGDERVCALWPRATPATEDDWRTEFLDLILAVRVVPSIDEALAHIARWGTSNADAIITEDAAAARRFAAEVDSGSVFVNASTRFSDGGEFGFGAEIGISTQKLHARGPMGLEALTAPKFVVWGKGQIRT